ncbi:SDR family NAD(P)-dependent oxidoreductase [Komagataeibacter melomenusus]
MELPQKIATRIFTREDQEKFCILSGDCNPIHMDPVAARRTIIGSIVVHGMHTLLWALDRISEGKYELGNIAKLDIRFISAINLDKEVSLFLVSHHSGFMRLAVRSGEKKMVDIKIHFQEKLPVLSNDDIKTLPVPDTPLDITIEDLSSQSGTVSFSKSISCFSDAFPHAAICFNPAVLRQIAACSTLVGVYCPGLRSMFSSLSLEWTEICTNSTIEYSVSDVDKRFNIVTLNIKGEGFTGTAAALSPPAPPRQLSINEIKENVHSDCFSGQVALVIGGSRGLGELTAKIIAAGGGTALLSYNVGQKDAERVVEDIRKSGGHAECFHYDINEPSSQKISSVLCNYNPTHLYYFATGKIIIEKKRIFDRDLFEKYLNFYVYGFIGVCNVLRENNIQHLSCFYPSSTAVESRPPGWTEYAMAKATGEIMAKDISSIFPGYQAQSIRLPKLMTDQTVAVTPQRLPGTINILLPVLIKLQTK